MGELNDLRDAHWEEFATLLSFMATPCVSIVQLLSSLGLHSFAEPIHLLSMLISFLISFKFLYEGCLHETLNTSQGRSTGTTAVGDVQVCVACKLLSYSVFWTQYKSISPCYDRLFQDHQNLWLSEFDMMQFKMIISGHIIIFCPWLNIPPRAEFNKMSKAISKRLQSYAIDGMAMLQDWRD